MHEDRSVLDLLNADYTFVNERLARHYGIPNVYGSQFRRVPITDDARRGLLGQASILTVTSYPNRTSPVQRGKWILTNLLGIPPQPPPPNVPALKENAEGGQAALIARAHGSASPGRGLRGMSQGDGPGGLRAREFRRHRALAHQGRWRGDRSLRHLYNGVKVDGVVGLRDDDRQPAGSLCRRDDGADADLRAGAGFGICRYAC